ncbi:uncharacterized protein LOC124252770 [Haliotis rubra]|uniref:uncharacterized protein LOC124252770 n=1 Tax=Haliotis rubra TaxID=36100 RepID=UPI001EE53917|nr:uncharacterized protein LOC124252770 [Haliotis rubra]
MQSKGGDDPKNVCLYHDKRWRGRFQYFINQIRGNIVPVIYLAKFKKLVCTCKSPEKFPKNFNKVLSEITIKDIPNIEAREFVKYLYGCDIWKEQHRSRSAKRLIYLLQCALRQDFALIDCVDVNADGSKLSQDIWTSETARFTVKTSERRFMGFLIGQRGQNIRKIERQFGCKINLKVEFVSVQDHTIAAEIKYLARNPLNLEDVSQYLVKEANRIAVEREYCRLKTLEYYRRKGERAVRKTHRSKDVNINEKMSNVRKYEKRFKNNNRQRHGRQGNVSKLDGSRCLNCLVGYTTPLFKAAKCTYHPGYIVADQLTSTNGGKKQMPNHRWTCCDLATQTANATLEEHAQTGCTVGFHNWRPVGKQDRRDMKSRIVCLDESSLTVEPK